MPVVTRQEAPKNEIKALLSTFISLALICGLPWWIYSTTTERRTLPWRAVDALNQNCPITFTRKLSLDEGSDSALIWKNAFASALNDQKGCTIFSLVEGDPFHLKLDGSLSKPTFAGNTLTVPALTLASLTPLTELIRSLDSVQDTKDPRAVKFASRYKLVFSLFYQNASTQGPLALSTIDLKPYLESSILPTLVNLNSIHNFSIETQVQYYAPLAIAITSTRSGSVIQEEDLKAFINSAEWNLAASGEQHPTLHFIAYIPSSQHQPMRLARSNGNPAESIAFTVPQFGGVAILDTASQSIHSALNKAFNSFSLQTKILLGLSDAPDQVEMSQEIQHVWRRQTVIKTKTLANSRDAVETLKAIIKLTREIRNMRINKEVQGHVMRALAALSECEKEQDATARLHLAIEASSEASKAFFHPSMLGLLYFPQEHKYAVYTPLFGPIALPMLALCIRELSKTGYLRNPLQRDKSKIE